MRRFLRNAFVLVFVLVVLAGATGYAYLVRSLPVVNGEISVAGLTAPVDIIRDRDAIPHIIAATRMSPEIALVAAINGV